MPRLPETDNIGRALRTDSDLLRQTESWVRGRIYGLEDAQLRALRDAYLQAYREIMSTLADAYDSGGKPELGRRARLLAAIEREIDALFNAITPEVQAGLDAGWRQGYYGRAWILDEVSVLDWMPRYTNVIPTEAIRSVLEMNYLGVSDWIDLERGELVSRIKRSITQSLIQGEGMAKARNRLVTELGIKPGQTRNFKGSMYRAMLITRTEIMRASNQGALAIYEQNQDVLLGWEWTAAKDERTCPICGALDGRVFPFDDPQLPPPMGSHPGCRCTPVPVLRDQYIQTAIAGIRETYGEWAARQGIISDGGLDAQRGARPHGLNRTG